MQHLDGQIVTPTWAEISGVSGVVGEFKIGNEGNNIMFLSVSPTQPAQDSQKFEKLFQQSFKIVENVAADNIWIRLADSAGTPTTSRLSILVK